MSYRLSFYDFPVTWSPIEIPEGFVLFRASNSDPISVEKPRWFGNKEIGMKYKNKYGGKIFACEMKKGIKLIDIRVLKYIVLETMTNAEMNGLLNKELREKLNNFMIAFGLHSHKVQLKSIKDAYEKKGEKFPYADNHDNNIIPFENFGSRISYGIVDDSAAIFLSELFGNLIDGYISPNLKTPWHNKHFNHEICLFNPKKSLKMTIDIVDDNNIYLKLPKIKIIDLISKVYRYRHFNKNTPDIIEDENEFTDMDMDINDDIVPMNIGGNEEKMEIDFFSKYHSSDIVNINELILENDIEKSYMLQCFLSKNEKLKNFIYEIFIKLTLILYQSFKIVSSLSDDQIIRTIQYHYRPLVSIKENTFFILKPGISKFIKTNIIEKIINKNEKVKITLDKYELNELMGAIYGIITHGGMFTLIFKASIESKNDEKYKDVFVLRKKFSQVIEGIRELFSLDKTFDEQKFLKLIIEDDLFLVMDYEKNKKNVVYDVKKGNMRNIIIDMIVNNPNTHGLVSIVRKNLNNQEYIRTRRQKKIEESYVKIRYAPKCPTFYTDVPKVLKDGSTIIMVDGDEWYEVSSNGFFKNIMIDNRRFWKAGPSGSTFMWMNMVFGILGTESTPQNYKLMLLCIICDFVPIYHSLTEVLMIYSKENPFIEEENQYLISINPVIWLLNHFDINYTEDIKNVSDIIELLKNKIKKL